MNKLWQTDEELFALARRELFTAVVGDVMDKLGLLRQFLPPEIQPLERDMVVVGRAMPVLQADCLQEGTTEQFALMLRALDDLKPHEVYVCVGGSPRYSSWGELMSTRAIRCGAAGAVLDGYTRDTRGILAMGFPTFARGCYAQDQGPRGKAIDFRVAVESGGVRIEPGDLVFGDADGVCVVPRRAEGDVIAAALEKKRKEEDCRSAIEAGMSASEVFGKFGVL